VKITLERNRGANEEQIPYHAVVENVTAIRQSGKVFRVPIRVRYFGLEKTFVVEACGFKLEGRRPNELVEPLEQLLNKSINSARFPSYVFIARRAKKVYPVYAVEDQVYAVSPSGHVFRHVELAKVREYLTDYLHEAGILGQYGVNDKLHVRGVSSRDLQLRRPVMYLKKRIPGQIEFWAPVFENAGGTRIYTYAASARREVPRQDGLEVILLRDLVAHVLMTDRRLLDHYDLRPDRLQLAYWNALRAHLRDEGEVVVNEVTLPLFSHAYGWFVMEHRSDEDRYGLYIGQNEDDVRRRVQLDFNRRGVNVLNNPTARRG
jgi:hypothetical protein